MKGPALIPRQGRRCWWGTRPTGEPDVYKCQRVGTVERYSRVWCELHDPVNEVTEAVLRVWVAMVTGKAA